MADKQNSNDNPNVAKVANTSNKLSHGFFAAIVAVVAVLSFMAGTRSEDIYRVASPIFGIKTASKSLDTTTAKDVYDQIAANYDGEIDLDKLSDGAARGVAEALGDEHTVFMDKDEAEEFQKSMQGEISGIGAEIGVRNLQPTVLRVLDDSPAQKAGVKVGDIFISVNNAPMAGKTASEVAQKVTGEAGTTVRLVLKRGDDSLNLSITRAKINDPSVRWSIDGDIGILILSRFDDNTGTLARKAAQEFIGKGVKGVILDVRNNGGGYLTAAQEVASLWLEKGQIIVVEKSRGQVKDAVKATGDPLLKGKTTVVLTNGSSASASEIVAGALHDHKAATLLGEKTFGKGTVQKVVSLPGGRLLKVTAARWYTPNDKNITKDGIEPDEKIELSTDDINAGRDPQLSRAKEKLQ